MHLALLPLLAACSGEAPVPAPDPEPVVAPEPEPSKLEGIHVEPMSIRWDAEGHNLSVEAHLIGKGVEVRKEAVHIGVTVITESDKEVDLLVHTLFPAAMGESVMFSTELEENPKHVLIGAWNKRVEPCESERPGCVEFGFVLDESIASFPAKLYTEGMRQRFIPEGLEIQVKGDAEKIASMANDYAKPFGTTVTTAAYEGDLGPGVWTSRSDDLGLAQAIGAELGLEYQKADAELPSPVVVVSK